jgi:hypothetical protein
MSRTMPVDLMGRGASRSPSVRLTKRRPRSTERDDGLKRKRDLEERVIMMDSVHAELRREGKVCVSVCALSISARMACTLVGLE